MTVFIFSFSIHIASIDSSIHTLHKDKAFLIIINCISWQFCALKNLIAINSKLKKEFFKKVMKKVPIKDVWIISDGCGIIMTHNFQ